MAEEALKFKFSAEGTEQTSAAFAKVTGELARQEDQYKELAHETQHSARLFDELGGALGQLTPGFHGVAESVGRASGAIRGMTSVLGGLGGIAAGGAIAALGLFAEHMIEAKKATEELKKAQEEETEAARKQSEALESAMSKRLTDLRMVGHSAEEIALEKQLADVEAEIERTQDLLEHFKAPDRRAAMELRERLAASRDDIKQKLDVAAAERQFTPGMDTEEQKAEAEAARKRQEEAFKKEMDLANTRWDSASAGADRDSWKPGFERNEGMQQNALSMQKSLAKEFVDVQKQRFTQELSLAEKHEQDLKKLDDERKKSQAQVTHAALQAGEMVASAGIHALSELAKGHKISAREIMSGIGDEMVASGTRWLFEGLAQEIINPAGGTALIGIGAAEIAAGIGFGAASADRSGAGGGGSGARTRVSEPTYYGGSAASNNPGSVIVNMPTVVSPSAADGQRVVQAVMQARRQGLVPMGYGA